MPHSNNIILIGPMGAGKTTVGKKLAQHLNIDFIDIDEEIERILGVDISTIFDTEGETGFRRRETEILKKTLSHHKNSIIATGGGCVLAEENRRILAKERLIFHIDVNLKTQYKRLKSDKRRPILQVENLQEKLKQLREERHPIYQSVADYQIITNKSNIWLTINEINSILEKHT